MSALSVLSAFELQPAPLRLTICMMFILRAPSPFQPQPVPLRFARLGPNLTSGLGARSPFQSQPVPLRSAHADRKSIDVCLPRSQRFSMAAVIFPDYCKVYFALQERAQAFPIAAEIAQAAN